MINILDYGDVKGVGRYDLICDILKNCQDAKRKIHYSEEAIKLAEKHKLDITFPLIVKGTAYLDKGDLLNALETFFNLTQYYERADNKIGLAVAYDYISQIYDNQDNMGNAILYLKKSINILEAEKDSIKLASVKHNLGYLYFQTEEYDSALVLYRDSKYIYEKLDYTIGMLYCIGNMGTVHSRMNNLDTAKKCLLYALEKLQEYNDDYAVSDFTLEFAKVLAKQNNIGLSILQAKKGFDIANKNGIVAFKRDASRLLSQLYEKKQRYDSAYHYQSKYIVLNDSIKNIESVQKMADLRTHFEVEQKQIEVDLYKKKGFVRLLIIASLILILLLSIALIYVYYSNLKRVRKFSGILEARKKIMIDQSAELQELNRIKDKFFSILSHDLRGPISSIGGISVLIKESMESDNKALLNEVIEYVDNTVLTVSSLLENLLNWAQSQQGQFPFYPESVNLRTLMDEIIKLYSTISISKNIKITHQISDDLFVMGDNNSLMTIFRNLISNALKYTEEGGEVIVNGHRESSHVIVKISDTGIGIPSEKIPSLFELKEDKSTWGTQREKGFGLGLKLVDEFVKLNNGEIAVESILDKGTTFTIAFPVA